MARETQGRWHAWSQGGHGMGGGWGDMVANHERLMTGHGHMVAWLHEVGLIHDINSFAWVQGGGMSIIGLP